MSRSKIYLMIVLLLVGFFIVSTSAADEHADQNFQIDAAYAKNKMHPKIESNLLNEKPGAFAAQIQSESTVQVVFELKGSDKSYIKSLEDSGAVVEAVHKNLVQASVPASKLQAMAQMPFVNYVRSPMRPYKDAVVVSEGVGVINASMLHSLGFNGSGVKIAVLDIGFANYSSKLGIELPDNVTVQSFRADRDITGGGEDHGTAVAEIVYDIAPDAKLYLINFDTDVEFGKAADYAISQNVDIISMSLNWVAGPFNGTGDIDEIVDNATSSGILWVNSAGNYAKRHWEGKFNDPDRNGIHNFSGTDETISISVTEDLPEFEVILSWDDWPKSNQNYDLCVYYAGIEEYCSRNVQNGAQRPVEGIRGENRPSGMYEFKIKNISATREVNFEIYSRFQNLEHQVASSSLGIPADARDVIAVGATLWSNDSLEPFSSQGPTNDGRTQPDLVAPDGVSTNTSYPYKFFGTSASAPHVAGAAALLLGINPSLTNQMLRAALESTAKDLETPGKDNLTGSGRIDVWAASNKIPPTVTANSPVDLWVNNGTIPHLNASISSISGVMNATVNVSRINNTIGEAVLVNNSASGFWTNDSIAVNTSNEGLQNLTITVYDNANNKNAAVNLTVRVDNIPPNVTISSPVNNSIVNTRNVTIRGNVTDNFGIISESLEHIWQNVCSPPPPCVISSGSGGGIPGNPKNFSINKSVTLHEGWNRLVLTYTDVAGNSGNASVNVTLDTPPAVTNLSLSTFTPEINQPVNITVNVRDLNLNLSSIMVTVRSKSFTNTSPMVHLDNGRYYFNFTNTSEYSRYDVTINASDLAGNINNTEKTWFVTKKSHISNVSIYREDKGEIAYGPKIWNIDNFPGLMIKETLSVTSISGWTIYENNLIYSTTRQEMQLDVVGAKYSNSTQTQLEAAGLEEFGDNEMAAKAGNYTVVGWMGEGYVAIKAKTNKLARIVHEQDTNDTKNLTTNETWDIGEGWALTLNSTDTKAMPAQALLILSKDGVMKDDNVISFGTPNAKPIYTYVETQV